MRWSIFFLLILFIFSMIAGMWLTNMGVRTDGLALLFVVLALVAVFVWYRGEVRRDSRD